MPAVKNVKKGSASRSPAKKTTAPAAKSKPGPKKGTKRSPESIAKAIATRKANAKKNGGAAKTSTAKTSRATGPRGLKTFKLYAAEGNELAYLVDARGRDEVTAIHQSVSSGSVQAGIPIVAVSVDPIVVDAIPQDPVFVVRGAVTRRGRPPKAAAEKAEPKAASSSTGKKRGPKPGYKRSPESIAKAKATRAANAKKKAKAAAAGSKPAPAKAPAPTPPAPAAGAAVPAGNPFAE